MPTEAKSRIIQLDLPKASAKLYALLLEGGDVPIETLRQGLGLAEPRDPRHAQQMVSPYVTRLNRRIRAVGLRAQPGRMKQTYTLVSV
jgi:hypothetical protein